MISIAKEVETESAACEERAALDRTSKVDEVTAGARPILRWKPAATASKAAD